MKKIICVFLALGIVFLSGCSGIFKPKTGLIEISGLNENTDYISTADFNGEYWLLLSGVFVPSQTQDASEEEESEIEAEEPEEAAKNSEDITEESEELEAEEYNDEEEPDGEFHFELNLVNPKNGRVKKSASLKDCPIEDIFGAEFDDEGNITVYDEYNKKCLSYSPDLKQTGKVKKYTFSENESLAKKNKNVDDIFSEFDSFCYDYTEYYSDARVNAYAFYGDDNYLYFANNERFSPSSACAKRVLGTMIKPGEFSREEIRIYDFSSSVIINSFVFPSFGEKKTLSLQSSAIAENSAFISVGIGESYDVEGGDVKYTNEHYIWNYTLDAKNIPFESEKLGAGDIEKKNSDFCADIKKRYGIDVHINEANEETKNNDEVYALKLNASPFSVYKTLVGINCFFAKLPENFVKETYTGMEHIVPAGFDIFIAGDIVGYPSAYANIWGEKFQISLETCSFNVSTFSHEFMHIIDARLEDLFWEEGLDGKWSEFNPEGFEYLGYQDMGAEGWEDMDFSKYEKYFATSYCMSAATEDRADTFASLFDYGIGDYDEPQPYWYKPGTAAAKKAEFLCEIIRKAYPCMKNAGIQIWEKSIKSDLSA